MDEKHKRIADIVCRSLIAIVAILRKEYNLPPYQNITIKIEPDNCGKMREIE